jgi:hypothetical protein
MYIFLLDNTLRLKVYHDPQDREYDDNICVSIDECCDDDEKIFRGDETNIYLNSSQAQQLALALLNAAEASRRAEMGD